MIGTAPTRTSRHQLLYVMLLSIQSCLAAIISICHDAKDTMNRGMIVLRTYLEQQVSSVFITGNKRDMYCKYVYKLQVDQ
ncbi:hypothetical protein I7I48_06672 [Histoplasma ohiense]|nr:hypothetical protein I7I48_06672 [Histoplasma ohiense (nom. inval.)]